MLNINLNENAGNCERCTSHSNSLDSNSLCEECQAKRIFCACGREFFSHSDCDKHIEEYHINGDKQAKADFAKALLDAVE